MSLSYEEYRQLYPETASMWYPARYAISEAQRSKKTSNHILIILNNPLTDEKYVRSLLSSAIYVACADGGAKQLYDLLNDDSFSFQSTYAPDAICGDFDSCPPDVEEFYRQRGCTEFIKDTDQNSTDFRKCLRHVAGKAKSLCEQAMGCDEPQQGLDIVVLGGLGGRADQAFSQIHHLYVASALDSPAIPYIGKTYLISANNVMFLLKEGLNVIETPIGPGLLAESVGIIPIGQPSVITTKGLEWDVTAWPTEFGHRLSTSNHIKRESVHVTTSEQVLFTIELAKRKEEDVDDAKGR